MTSIICEPVTINRIMGGWSLFYAERLITCTLTHTHRIHVIHTVSEREREKEDTRDGKTHSTVVSISID